MWVARRKSSKELRAARMMALQRLVSELVLALVLAQLETRLERLQLRLVERLQVLALPRLQALKRQASRREQRRWA